MGLSPASGPGLGPLSWLVERAGRASVTPIRGLHSVRFSSVPFLGQAATVAVLELDLCNRTACMRWLLRCGSSRSSGICVVFMDGQGC